MVPVESQRKVPVVSRQFNDWSHESSVVTRDIFNIIKKLYRS